VFEVFGLSRQTGLVNRRFPGYRLPADYQAVFQPDGGFLEPEKCITTQARLAAAHGAQVISGRKVISCSAEDGGLLVRLDHGEVRARQVVLCAGAWMPTLVPSLAPLLRPERQVVGWFSVAEPAAFVPGRFPVFVLTTDDGIFYGFPEHDVAGFKIGKYHHRSELVDPERAGRTVDAVDEAVLRQCVQSFFPRADGPLVRSSTCIFTNTPDEHFIIDRLPDMPEALVVSACSGHGFKFCSVIGEIVADLVAEGGTRHDLSLFKLNRFDRGV
jgi:sarcosine oxidase